MEESSLIAAPSILDGDNYETWAIRMTVYLQELDVWEAVEENYEEYLKEEYKGNERIKYMKMMNLIREFEMKKMKESDAVKTMLIEQGFKVYFEDRNCIIKDVKGKEVFNIKMKGKSFALNLLEDEHAAVLQQDSTTMLWHRRLGHFHHDVVLYMKKNQIAEGLPELEKDLPISATCQYGKQTKLSFKKKNILESNPKIATGAY
ncbi:hypothetical protein CK203_024287 [Vitis vinifera]|uniref:DUF4219 domain-containing protein n=1 Tax=Vitis vinifera TaxID=29760 RepID=A0A438I4F1_VITVI|nr:hypothetical protein CK203_024287 [Vitis vinifera]